jgi:hypothetical protein
MHNNPSTLLLDDVLLGFRRDNFGPAPAAVADWCARFPRFADEISDEAILWAEENMNASLYRPKERDESLYAAVRSTALNSLHRARAERESGRQVNTFADAMIAAGIDVPEMSRQMSLPRSVMSQLVRGDIMGASIPHTLTEMLSRLLRQTVDWTRACYPATLVAAYGNDCGQVTHKHAATMTFQDAVMKSSDIDDAQRTFWLEDA